MFCWVLEFHSVAQKLIRAGKRVAYTKMILVNTFEWISWKALSFSNKLVATFYHSVYEMSNNTSMTAISHYHWLTKHEHNTSNYLHCQPMLYYYYYKNQVLPTRTVQHVNMENLKLPIKYFL